MSRRVAINGFGRIGRLVFRQIMERDIFDVIAINDIAPLDNLVYLLRYDSVQTRPDAKIVAQDSKLLWDSKEIRFLSER